jgi:hypothetical protein
MNFTMEELYLIALYAIPDRTKLAATLRESLPFMEEPEMREMAQSAAAKLESMTDAGFQALDLAPDFDMETEDGAETEE